MQSVESFLPEGYLCEGLECCTVEGSYALRRGAGCQCEAQEGSTCYLERMSFSQSCAFDFDTRDVVAQVSNALSRTNLMSLGGARDEKPTRDSGDFVGRTLDLETNVDKYEQQCSKVLHKRDDEIGIAATNLMKVSVSRS